MRITLIAILISILLFCKSYGQKESNNWYFGTNAGVNFSSGSPVAVTNGAMTAVEGCAAISDSAGNLLFYTNGESVWNRNHTLMPNGNNSLNGSNAATQNAIIVPKPNDLTKFYIFTVDADGGPNGLNYSEVDMTLAGGLGDLVLATLNTQLISNTSEKVTAVKHYNLRDFWVITHKWNSNEFDAFLVSPTGVNPTPVATSIGTSHSGSIQNSHGYMKVSTDGTKLGLAITGLRNAEVFDFNPSTGSLSNPINIPSSVFNNITTYGVEFSPNSRYLYIGTSSNPDTIRQFDLQAGTVSQIIQSGLTPIGIHSGFIYALQLGLDGKIYGSQTFSSFLAVINNPDIGGIGCGFAANSVSLSGRIAQGGLPNFIKNNFIEADYTYLDTCFRDNTIFTVDFDNPDSVKWDFGDPLSGNNFSNDTITSHIFSAPGSYNVSLIVYYRALTDTVRKIVQVLPLPQISFGVDTNICEGQSLLLDAASSGGTSYLWQDNSTGTSFSVDTTGNYYVIVTLNGCIGSDTINVTDNPIPQVNLGRDTALCGGNIPYQLNAQNAGSTFLWQDGTTAQTYNVSVTGTYTVTVTANNCSNYDEANVIISQTPIVYLGNDTTLCEGFQLFYNVTNDSSTYIWNDGFTGPTRFVDTLGIYAVTVTNNYGCSASDMVTIDLQFEPTVYLGEDTTLCSGQPITLDATNYGATYQWQDNSTSATNNPISSAIYGVSVYNQCGIASDSISIDFDDCNCLVYIPNSFTPNSDNRNDYYNYKFNCNQFKSSISIYNRIGQLLFHSDNPDIGWDGTYNDKPSAEGIYVYQLHYSGYNDGKLDEKTERGTFLLLR